MSKLSFVRGVAIDGVLMVTLPVNLDPRGSLFELHRRDWPLPSRPKQWNILRSEPGALRGMHLHARRDDFICVLDGVVRLALHDARPGSPTRKGELFLGLEGVTPQLVFVPSGIFHGLLAETGSLTAYGLSAPWQSTDEFNCRWDDPAFGFDWPVSEPILADHDRLADPYCTVVARSLQEATT